MKFRYIITPIFLVLAAVSAALIGVLLVKTHTEQELKELCSSLQAVIFVFSASVGSLALIKYWGAAEAEIEHKRWEKLKHFDSLYERFRTQHSEIIMAFEWPHILRERFLPLCEKAIIYDSASHDSQIELIHTEEIELIRKFDEFLEFFENLYFAITRRLVSIEDLLTFMQYNLILLGDAYFNPNDARFKNYINTYYYNIKPLLELIEKPLKDRLKEIELEKNYPRSNKKANK